MARLFNLRRPNGKLAAQHHTRELAERELAWHRASGAVGPFTIERIEREPDTSRWGYGYPNRFAGKWPSAKLDEFRRQYADGKPIARLAEYFGTNAVVVTRIARRMGFQRRIDDPIRWERDRGRWTEREDQLINAMYDQEVSIGEIAAHLPRTEKAITQRLRTTAAEYSNRSRFGRFICKPGSGRRGISPVLEET